MRRPGSWRDELLAPVTRWRCERKQLICIAINRGHVSIEDVVVAHGLARAEVERWLEAYARAGMDGLRVARPRRSVAA
jgi:hypothetical protein